MSRRQGIAEEYALSLRVLEAHDNRDVSTIDALEAEAKRLGIQAPDVLRRLADLRRRKDGAS